MGAVPPGNPDLAPRILVVDDEANITELVAMALRYVGFEVATAASVERRCAIVRGFRPDLVVLDVMMPDLDGFEVLPPAPRRRRPRAGACS